jgi:hypothetical protein
MPTRKWGVAKVTGSNPERFFIFLMNGKDSEAFMRTSDFLSEEELRSDLANREINEAEIETLIQHAQSLSSAQAKPH